MKNNLIIYNTLTRKKEVFEPNNPPMVGLYVCGPTVYGDPHLGHARPAITFDILFRYLKYLDYKVRYVRNITDVGHLEDDADDGEDKIQKKAKLEQVEPMEIAQYYTDRYHVFMDMLNVLRPSIEPRASGHIIEQLDLIDKITKNGFAYEVKGSVYFDVDRYHKKFHYGKLSGRVLEDLYANTRNLDGQSDKRKPYDFALWKKAESNHLMKWPSKWSLGFPGWHLECSAMSSKYLGETFDIHGGGLDLLFPHHECEIAQSVAANGQEAVKYWMHNNMITINGQKMGKSLGNFITLEEFFSGCHKLLEKAYSPMTIRFFILQAHYRSTVDFSNDALQAAEKGLERLIETTENLDKISPSEKSTINIDDLKIKCNEAMNDDLNSPLLIAHLFEYSKVINKLISKNDFITENDLNSLKLTYNTFVKDILGLKAINKESTRNSEITEKIIELLLTERMAAKARKDFEASDRIRDKLIELGFEIKDKKDGFEWNYKG